MRAHQYLADEYVEIQELQANDLVHLGEVVLFMIRHLKAPSAELENFADRLISGKCVLTVIYIIDFCALISTYLKR